MTHDLLRRVDHAVLCVWSPDGDGPRLRVTPSPAWWDGAGLWLSVDDDDARGAVGSADATVLVGSEAAGTALVVSGPARVYGPRAPVRLALHGPMVATAMGALALHAASPLPRNVPRLLSPRRRVVRVLADAVEPLEGLPPVSGVAPALPPAVPADVRRAVAGRRVVTLLRPGRTGARAVVWRGGFVLDDAGAPAPRVAVVVGGGGRSGMGLEGPLAASGIFHPERALWWHDGATGSAVLSAGASTVLPD